MKYEKIIKTIKEKVHENKNYLWKLKIILSMKEKEGDY